jgi:hypothetical protein
MKKDTAEILLEARISRRDFMKISAFTDVAPSLGGVVSLDFLAPSESQAQGVAKPFTFAVMADQHTMGPKNNYMKLRWNGASRKSTN